jgi:hypothetical protein
VSKVISGGPQKGLGANFDTTCPVVVQLYGRNALKNG